MKSYLLLVIALFLSACATSENKADHKSFSQLEKGVTTENDVRATLGPPMFVNELPDGSKVYVYGHDQAKPNASSNNPRNGRYQSRTVAAKEMFQIWFDENGVVKNYSFDKPEL